MIDRSLSLDALASACANRLPAAATAFHEDQHAFQSELSALISAIRDTHARFAFDRAGRPSAIAAIRQALPAIEAELFDAVLEDFACELAATEEALYRVALAPRTA